MTRAQKSLTDLARVYFLTEVAGQARATIEAKRRDLGRFLAFYDKLYSHDRPDEWYRSVTREFLKQLRKGRPAQATVVRTYATASGTLPGGFTRRPSPSRLGAPPMG